MVASTRRPRATYADVLAAPENMIAEVINGELSLEPRPATWHQHASIQLRVELRGVLGSRGGPEGWIMLAATELHLRPGDDLDILVPDIAGWRRRRLPQLMDTAFMTLAPDWVCEVLSSSTELRDRTAKLAVYAREGVAHLWLVSVRTRHVEVYRLTDGLWTLLGTAAGDVKVRLAPFEEVEIDLSHLWTEGLGDGSGA